MSRSVKKGPYVHPKLAKKSGRAKRSDNTKETRTLSR